MPLRKNPHNNMLPSNCPSCNNFSHEMHVDRLSCPSPLCALVAMPTLLPTTVAMVFELPFRLTGLHPRRPLKTTCLSDHAQTGRLGVVVSSLCQVHTLWVMSLKALLAMQNARSDIPQPNPLSAICTPGPLGSRYIWSRWINMKLIHSCQ